MDDVKLEFSFEKKLGVAECLCVDIRSISKLIERLMFCMKETNQKHGVQCEFFRLDFRQPYFYEEHQFPIGSLILDMKWGSKKELESLPKPPKEDCDGMD